MCCEKFSRRPHGFTLVELMVVIVIMGLLASLVTINVRGHLIKARQTAAKQEISAIMQALEIFYATYGRYPTNEEGLAVLTQPSDKLPEKILEGDTVDPWGNVYRYACPGVNRAYDIISYGADGREGGSGADADVRSDQLKEK